jgi:hypothetical protein
MHSPRRFEQPVEPEGDDEDDRRNYGGTAGDPSSYWH